MRSVLAHVCIETDDFASTEAFYRLLGIERRFEFRNLDEELVGVYLAFADQTYIEIIKVKQPRKAGLIRHFAIEVDSVDAAKAALEHGGVAVSDKELGIDHTWMVTCHDPNGVFIELHEYTDKSLQLNGGRCTIDYTPS